MEVKSGRLPVKRDKYANSKSTKIFIFLMLLIPLSNFVVFTIYGNLGGIPLSLRQFNGLEEKFVGFDNYEKFFKYFYDLGYDKIIKNSLNWLPVVLGVMFPLTLFFSFFFYKKVPFTGLSIVLLFIPNIIPGAVMAEFYRRMWDAGGGVVESGLFTKMFSFVSGREINWLSSYDYANWALYIYTVWFGFGINSLLVWGAMSRIPAELVESAQIDGASLAVEFFKITIPVIWPTLSIVLLMYIMTPFNIYVQPLLLAENGSYGTTTINLMAMNELRKPDPHYAAAINILVACVSIPVSIIIRKLLDRVYSVVEI